MPVPLTPVGGARVLKPSSTTILLTVRNAEPVGSNPVVLTVDLSDSPTFADSATTLSTTTPQSDGATTDVRVSTSGTPSTGDRQQYWRVRAAAGEATSATSPVATFVLTPDISGALTVPDPPTLVSPLAGMSLSRNLTVFRVKQPANTPNVVRYDVQVSSTSSFNQNVQTCSASALNPTDEASCPLGLSVGSYFWRARSVAPGTASNGLSGSFSAAVQFQVTNETLGLVNQISPTDGSLMMNPATISVSNVTRTGVVGPITYLFSLTTGDTGYSFGAVATATVPEDQSGTTSWTIPFDVPVGRLYSVHVQAVDTATGVTGEVRGSHITVVSAQSVPLTLLVNVPGAPGTCGRGFQLSTVATGDLGSSAVTVDAGLKLQMQLAPNGLRRLSGTIGGYGGAFSVFGTTSGTATASGTLTGHNTASGSFDGGIRIWTSIDGFLCPSTGGGWSLIPR